jgi:hypothetical protein
MPENGEASPIPTKSADAYLTGTLKRSPSYSREYGSFTIGELDGLAKAGDRKAARMLSCEAGRSFTGKDGKQAMSRAIEEIRSCLRRKEVRKALSLVEAWRRRRVIPLVCWS